jgi:hypothetical protein
MRKLHTSLRIKRTAKRIVRPDGDRRVRYEHGDFALVPEDLVLRRWKDLADDFADHAR